MTFTTRAAGELVERLSNCPDALTAGIWVGTFHNIASRILTAHGAAIGLQSPFSIYNKSQQLALLQHAVAQIGCDHPLQELHRCISRRKRLGIPAGQQRYTRPFDPPIMLQVDSIYRHLLDERHALDYDDLILKTVQLLQSDDETATLLRNRFRYLFVDEFHDVAPEHYELIRSLAPPRSPGQRVMVVADANQSIFGWRDARAVALLPAFQRDYHPRQIRLAENYRSTANLVRAAHQLITADGAVAHAVAVHPAGNPIDCFSCGSDQEEATWLARQIERACSSGAYSYGDIAVLYRVHQRATLAEQALLHHNIPLTRVQPDRFFDHPDVQSAIRYLALIAALGDDNFEPALNWPRVLVDEPTMLSLRNIARTADVSLTALARNVDAYAAQISPLTRAAIRGFMQTVAAELVPLANAPIDVLITKLLAVLTTRRSPIPPSQRSDAQAVLDILAAPLRERAALLHGAILSGLPITILHNGTLDSAAAAVILEHVLCHYLQHPVQLRRQCPSPHSAPFLVTLGLPLPDDQPGFAVTIRDARTIRFSLSTQAWRLAQLLLMRYERPNGDTFVVFDVETSGTHVGSAELLEVAASSTLGGNPYGSPFHSMVRPEHPIPPAAEAVHGIRWQDVCDAPPPATVLPALLHYIGDATLVGHNIEQFDLPLLRRIAREHGLAVPDHLLLDTCSLARRLLPDASHKLADLAHRFNIPVGQTHRALDDVRLNAQVFKRLLDLLAAEQELDAVNEALPLVALATQSAGIPAAGENGLLALVGARAKHNGLAAALHARVQTLLDDPAQLTATTDWLHAFPCALPADDLPWSDLEARWRTVVDHYCRTAGDLHLTAFLHYAALAAPLDCTSDEGRVAMMTIHNAKGREWPLVFLIGAEDDLLPGRNAPTATHQEERRVMYVAMTRARQRLCISWASSVAGKPKQPSRFLCDLPPDIITWRRKS
ncbi:MAG: hypothetical protein NVS2B7_24990 [Herpetosiphon sp.]